MLLHHGWRLVDPHEVAGSPRLYQEYIWGSRAEILCPKPIYRELRVAHPVWLLYFANAILASNVALGPWIHTASAVQNLSMLHDGERVSARGRVTALSERRGHQVVDLDLLLVAGGERPVMHVRHSAIYRLRSTEHDV